MSRLFHLLQNVAPVIGLVGLTMFVVGLKGDPQNMDLVWSSAPLVIFAVIFRPRPGHPMAAFLRMYPDRTAPLIRSKTKDTPEAKKAKDLLAASIEQNIAVMTHEPGDLPHHADPVKLIPRLPGDPRQESSWIGGAPMLPEGMPWPEASGGPLLFLAQIALDQLPPGIWGGLGPREGSLAFFVPSEGLLETDVLVLHLMGPLAERPWPDVKTTFYFGYDGDHARDLLAGIGWAVPPHPPRFPVEIQRHDGPVEAVRTGVPASSQRSTIQSDYDPRSPEFRPFNRITARALIAALIKGQEKTLDNPYRQIDDVKRASSEAVIAALHRHEADLMANRDTPFGPAEGEALVTALGAITTQQPNRDKEGDTTTTAAVSVIDDYWTSGIARVPFELLVQEAMRTNASQVPEAVRARYEALWQHDQMRDYVVMGGAVHHGFFYSCARDPVFLLELPSSNLVGWMFGDVSTLGLFIAPEDLAAGRWDRVWGDILN